MNHLRRAALVSALSLAALPHLTYAQSPLAGKQIRILVGFAAGGSTDILARMVADRMGPELQANVMVVNKPGANGNIAAAEVVRSAPDGLTLYMGSFNNPVNHAANRKLPFDFLRDFAPVGTVGYLPNLLIINKNVPAQNVRELVALVKSSPGKLSFGSSGAGSSQHMSGELFKYLAKVDMVHVPYNGSAPAVTDLIGGHIQVLFDNIPTAAAQAKANTVRALAVTSRTRSPQMPEVPTVAEAGLPDFDVTSFFALYAPAGTPAPVLNSLNVAVNKAVGEASARQFMAERGIEPGGGTPQQLRSLVESEVDKWRKVIQASGIKFED